MTSLGLLHSTISLMEKLRTTADRELYLALPHEVFKLFIYNLDTEIKNLGEEPPAHNDVRSASYHLLGWNIHIISNVDDH